MSLDETTCACCEQPKLLEKIAKWRAHRAELVEQGKGPVRPASSVTMLFHVVPSGSLNRRVLQESWRVTEQEKNQVYVPHNATSRVYNSDGLLFSAEVGDQSGAYGYTQIFRSGIVEYADSNVYGPIGDSDRMILGQAIERQMIHCYGDAIRRLREHEQNEDAYAGFSLIGVANKAFFSTHTRRVFTRNVPTVTGNIFNSPEVLVNLNDPEESPYSRTLRPLVDTMWQVAGLQETPFFKRNGEWDPFGRYN
jgi:hypothetical protein